MAYFETGIFHPVVVTEITPPIHEDVIDTSQVVERQVNCCVIGSCGRCTGQVVELSEAHPACEARDWRENGEGRFITCEPAQ